MTKAKKTSKSTKKRSSSSVDKKKPLSDSLRSESPSTPDPTELRLIELTQANRQLKRKIFDLYTVFEISRNFSSVLDYQTLLDSFLLTSLAQVSASRAAIYLKDDENRNNLCLARFKGFPRPIDPELYFTTKSKMAVYLSKLNRPVLTQELIDEIANKQEKELLQTFNPGLVIPLIYQTRLAGLLLIVDKISGSDFRLDDIEFLSILGNQIAVAFENARLYEAEKSATQQLRAVQQQLIHSERLAALGEMSAKVAHEINNPLGIIKNYLLLIRRAVGKNIEAGNYVDIVGQEIDRIARIVSELLDFHRPTKAPRQPTNIVTVVEDVLNLMSRQFKKQKIEVIRNFEENNALVMSSPENIKQVFLNIIINACDAMEMGGRLEIKTFRDNSDLVITTCDTGPGIATEVIPHIFEPFFTTKEAGKGTGLGLSVCYGIIKRHDGSITYRNIEAGGCFEVRLPIIEENEDE